MMAGFKSRHFDRDRSARAPTSNPTTTTPILPQRCQSTGCSRIVDLGFLRCMKAAAGTAAPGARTKFEIRRILTAFVDAEWLAEFDARLAAYQAELDGREEADRAQE